MDSAAAAILKLYGYLTFVESFRSFQIITFDCPERYESNIISQLRALSVVKNATWENENAYQGDPITLGAELSVDVGGTTEVTEVEGQASRNTRTLTSTSSGTIYVQVQNISGANYYVFSNSPSGTYSRFYNQNGIFC